MAGQYPTKNPQGRRRRGAQQSSMRKRGMSTGGMGTSKGIKKQHRRTKDSPDQCDYGTTGSAKQAEGSGKPHNSKSRSTYDGHDNLKQGMQASKDGPDTYKHPGANANVNIYGGY